MGQSPVLRAQSGREFIPSAVGLIALLIDPQERFLMLSHPRRSGKWEPVNGAHNGTETVLDGLLREIHEEIGADVRVKPLGTVHAYTFRYDDLVPSMVSIVFLFEYLSGKIVAGDDMTGSSIRWMTIAEISSESASIIVPSHQSWVFERAVLLYRQLAGKPDVNLQPDVSTMSNKYQ